MRMGVCSFGLFLSLLVGCGSSAIGQTLVSGADIAVSVQDLESDLSRVTPEERASTFSQTAAVKENLANLYVRRILASEAVNAKMDQHANIKAALELVRDRVLSDARLAQIDLDNQPNAQALEAYAQTVYKAEPKRFEAPEQVKIRHIFILLAEPNARAKAEQLLKELKAGADFEALAKASSQDPSTAAKGGDLGTNPRGRMVKAFEDAAFKLNQPGDLSDVVETSLGLHIIKLDERRAAGIRPFPEVKEALVQEARTQLINAGRQKEKDRILAAAQFDAAAIEAFAQTQTQK